MFFNSFLFLPFTCECVFQASRRRDDCFRADAEEAGDDYKYSEKKQEKLLRLICITVFCFFSNWIISAPSAPTHVAQSAAGNKTREEIKFCIDLIISPHETREAETRRMCENIRRRSSL